MKQTYLTIKEYEDLKEELRFSEIYPVVNPTRGKFDFVKRYFLIRKDSGNWHETTREDYERLQSGIGTVVYDFVEIDWLYSLIDADDREVMERVKQFNENRLSEKSSKIRINGLDLSVIFHKL